MADRPRVLLLGHTGKLGLALQAAFGEGCELRGCSRANGLDAGDFPALAGVLRSFGPDLVLNAAALNGLGPCERDPASALRLNALLPRFLAESSRELGFTLVHFSSDAVFDGQAGGRAYLESDPANPINVYGLTKFGGDCFVQSEARDYYIFRLSLMAGPCPHRTQFAERMVDAARAGLALRVADDILCSPSYSVDIAQAVRAILERRPPAGLYHLANAGSASLFRVVQELLGNLGLAPPLQAVAHTEFPAQARKNLATPLRSEKLEPLRGWEAAFAAFCRAPGPGAP